MLRMTEEMKKQKAVILRSEIMKNLEKYNFTGAHLCKSKPNGYMS